jgi:inosose dehydratase
VSLRDTRIALNPLQFFATADGWLDPALAPPLAERLRVIAEAGFTAIQPEITADGDIDGYRAALDAHGLLAGPGYTRAVWAEDAGERAGGIEAAKRSAAAHARLGVDVVFFTTGMFDGTARTRRAAVGAESDERRLAAIAEHVQDAGAAMRAEGVAAALHPHVGTWIETEHESRYVLENTDPSDVRFGPDIGHLAWAGADYLAMVRDFRERIDAIHIKDFDLSVAAESRRLERSYRAAVSAGLWREPGDGDADLAGVDAAWKPRADMWTVIEVDAPAAPTAVESIRRCAAWAFGDHD